MFRKTRITTLIIVCLIWCNALVCADTLSEQIDALLADPCLVHGVQGVVVKSLGTGTVLYQHSPDTLLVPASNMKLFTSAAALDLLTPNYRYQTKVYATVNIDINGVVNGDIVLQGSGDPVLATSDLTNLARQLGDRKIAKVTGDLVVDDTLFDSQKLGWGWAWDDLPYYYSAPVSALNLNRNVVDVYVYPGKALGSEAVVRTVPATALLSIESTATTGRADSEKTIWVYRKLGSDAITVGGSIPFGHKVENYEEAITVEEPALYAGHIFKTELAKRGIRILGSVRVDKAPQQTKQLASHDSPPLGEIVALMNKQSDNMIAETLLRTIGAACASQGSTEAGIAQIMQFCTRIGTDPSSISMTDGSGLARRNFVTAGSMVTLLSYMHSHKYARSFIDSLPVAGVDGTLRIRMTGTPAENHIMAKSGYVSNVSTLSGYALTRSEDTLAFSILLNNHLCTNNEAKAIQDKICELLVCLP